MDWLEAQEWEKNWHNNNPFIYHEQLKQEVYAEKMGLERDYPENDLGGIQVLDIGGGESSMLLKYKNYFGFILEPLLMDFPKWVRERYLDYGITMFPIKGEDFESKVKFDEVWIYNVLQHTDNPEKVIKNAKKCSKIIRLFEWIEEPISPGHIHILHEKELNKWLGGYGKVEKINDRGAHGLCYYGIFI